MARSDTDAVAEPLGPAASSASDTETLAALLGPSWVSGPQPPRPAYTAEQGPDHDGLLGPDGTRWTALILSGEDDRRTPLCGWTDEGRFVVWGPVQEIAAQVFDAARMQRPDGA